MKQKPISIEIRETEENILKALNNSSLPLDVIAMCLERILNRVSIQAETTYQQEKTEYESSIKHEYTVEANT